VPEPDPVPLAEPLLDPLVAVVGLGTIEPQPAMTDAAIRMAREPAVQQENFTVKPTRVNFERVRSGLQTLLRRNASAKLRHSPLTVLHDPHFSGVVNQKVSEVIRDGNHTNEERRKPQ
jgi:hypothetical protein